jgi:hypothetical protein
MFSSLQPTFRDRFGLRRAATYWPVLHRPTQAAVTYADGSIQNTTVVSTGRRNT